MKKVLIALQFILLCNQHLSSSIDEYYPYSVSPSASNYGNTGILEVPNARFSKEATLRWNYSSSFPFEYTSVTATPFSWLEATYRYTEIENAKYGPAAYSGNQSLKDKGFDVKFKLINETYYRPAIAIGIRDIAGTGRFSSEYIVSTKRINNFDLSLGIGWGLLGKESGISNPFISISDNFRIRSNAQAEGGTLSTGQWFSGDASLLAGIEYDLRKYGLRFKIEYDPTEPDKLPNGSIIPLKVNSRFNAGVTYGLSKNLDLSASFERGNQFRFSFSIKGNFLEDTIPKPKPKNVVRLNESQIERSVQNKGIFYRSLNKSLRDEGIFLQAASYKDSEVDIAIASTRYFSYTRPAGRAARVVDALSSEKVKRLNIHTMNGDLELVTFSLNRKEFQQADRYEGSPSELLLKSEITSTSETPLYERADFIPNVDFPEFEWNMSPAMKHQIGGPEGFYLGQVAWQTDTILKLRRNITLYTSIGINIFDTFKNLKNPSQSSIPHVRSDIQKYLSQGKNNIKRMHFEYMSSPYTDIFFRADLGYMEEMFAALGGEILYRPLNKRYALGLKAHKVKQRDYDQLFSLIDYTNITGHLGFYYEVAPGILTQLSAGEYLAGDVGATLDLSKRFNTGFTLGIFATKTNLSAEEFGEGSFDKGFYFSIPTQLFYFNFRSGNISFGLHPLTKDGGAFLIVPNSLYGIVGDSNKRSLLRDWNYILN